VCVCVCVCAYVCLNRPNLVFSYWKISSVYRIYKCVGECG